MSSLSWCFMSWFGIRLHWRVQSVLCYDIGTPYFGFLARFKAPKRPPPFFCLELNSQHWICHFETFLLSFVKNVLLKAVPTPIFKFGENCAFSKNVDFSPESPQNYLKWAKFDPFLIQMCGKILKTSSLSAKFL